MDYILITIAAILLGGNFVIQKIYQNKNGSDIKSGIFYNFYYGLFNFIIIGVINKFQLHFSLYSLIMAFLMMLFCIAYTLLGFKILKNNTVALYTLFLMSGGMTVPYIVGITFLNEEVTVLRICGLLVMLLSLVVANMSKEKIKAKTIFLCTMVFLLNGLVSVVSKFHQINTVYNKVSSMEFVMYTAAIQAILSGMMLPILSKKYKTNKKLVSKEVIVIIFISALVGGISYLLQLVGAVKLDACVLYPFLTGGSIVISAIIGSVVFKERIPKQTLIGIVLAFLGTLLFI